MKHFISEQGSILPVLSLILFVTLFALVVIFLLTDRRRGHHERMARLALGDDRRED